MIANMRIRQKTRIEKINNLIPTYPQKIAAQEIVTQLKECGINCSLRSVQRDLNLLLQDNKNAVSVDTRDSIFGWYKTN